MKFDIETILLITLLIIFIVITIHLVIALQVIEDMKFLINETTVNTNVDVVDDEGSIIRLMMNKVTAEFLIPHTIYLI